MAKVFIALLVVVGSCALVYSQTNKRLIAADERPLPMKVPPVKSTGGVTLMGTLSEWMYPNSSMPHGATVSDGGMPGIQTANFKTVLTTTDPIDKVVEFYEKKLREPAQSVITQDDSEGRPVIVKTIVVNRNDSSTTLVISRAGSENHTHISWLHHLRFVSP